MHRLPKLFTVVLLAMLSLAIAVAPPASQAQPPLSGPVFSNPNPTIRFRCPCQRLDAADLSEETRRQCAVACATGDETIGTLP